MDVLQLFVKHLDPHVVRAGPTEERQLCIHYTSVCHLFRSVPVFFGDMFFFYQFLFTNWRQKRFKNTTNNHQLGGMDKKAVRIDIETHSSMQCPVAIYTHTTHLRQGIGEGLMKRFWNRYCLKADRSAGSSISLCGVSMRMQGLLPSSDQQFWQM